MTSASIPLTVVTQTADALASGFRRCIACGFGVGLSWGTVAFTAGDMIISELVEVEDPKEEVNPGLFSYKYLPFIHFKNNFAGLQTLNIFIYEALSFLIILKILLKLLALLVIIIKDIILLNKSLDFP